MKRFWRSLFTAFCVFPVSAAISPDERATASAQTDSTCDVQRKDRLTRDAKAGDPEAQYLLAVSYVQEDCGHGDFDRALHWFFAAADGGHSEAAFVLGQLFMDGMGVKKDLALAERYLRQAATEQHVSAQHKLGLVLLWEAEIDTDREAALHWLDSAARHGDGMSAISLGYIHARGLYGVERDICLAFDWFENARQLGLKEVVTQDENLRQDHRRECE